jgi:hypothetical protein
MAKSLTTREMIFVNEYIQDCNATRAAKAAGYSPKTASQSGSRLLKSVKVAAEIARRTKGPLAAVEAAADAALHKHVVTTESIIESLAEMGLAHGVLAKFLKVNEGNLEYDFSGAEREELRSIAPMIAEIKTEHYAEGRGDGAREVIRSTVKFVERKGVLELLGRWNKLKAWTDTVEVKDPSIMTPAEREKEMREILQDALAVARRKG